MALRVLHIADIHLDTSFQCSPGLQTVLRDLQQDALIAAVNLAIKEQVHGVLIAGNLHNNDNLSFHTEALLTQQFKRLLERGIAVCYARMPKDYACASPWVPPTGTQVFDGEPRTITLYDATSHPVGVVCGLGCSATHSVHPAGLFPPRVSKLPTVGMMPTTLDTADDENACLPCTVSQLEQLRYDYWALGNNPQRKTLGFDQRIHYPGCLIGHHPWETGSKGVSLVDIADNGAVTLRFVPLTPVVWADIVLGNLTEYTSLYGIISAAVRKMEEAAALSPGAKLLARIQLTGPAACFDELCGQLGQDILGEMGKEICARTGAMDVWVEADRLAPNIAPEPFRDAAHVLSEAMNVLDDAALYDEIADAVIDQAAREYGLFGQHASRQETRKYVRSLIGNLDTLLCQKMLKNPGNDENP